MAKFKTEVIDKIKADARLYAVVSEAAGVQPASLPIILNRNGRTLNQYSVVAAVANYLGVNTEDIVIEENLTGAQT
jgi:hypothetical protein